MPAASFSWSDYLSLAEELGKRADEASLRSAVSRTYYYVYHLALSRAERNGFRPLTGGVHTQLWRLFGSSPEPQCQKLAVIAGRLKQKRERADYEDIYSRLADDVPELLDLARTFASLLNSIPSRHPNSSSMRQSY